MIRVNRVRFMMRVAAGGVLPYKGQPRWWLNRHGFLKTESRPWLPFGTYEAYVSPLELTPKGQAALTKALEEHRRHHNDFYHTLEVS